MTRENRLKSTGRYLGLVALAAFLGIPTGAWGGPWDSSYEGAAGVHAGISDSTQANTLDDHHRNLRQNARFRMEVEHFVGEEDGTNDDNGLHRLGSARCYMSATAPTELNDSHSSSATITDFKNPLGEVSGAGVTDLEDSASQSAAGAEDDVGHGRCWIDTSDNNRLYFFHGLAGDDTPAAVADGWVPASDGGRNLVFHGTFEGADGDGDLTSTTIPYGWTLVGTATFGYSAVPVAQGSGIELDVTAGAATSGVSQSFAGLQASAGYRVSVRVTPNSGDVCRLSITGDDHTIPTGSVANSSGTANQQLTVSFFTDSTPTAVVVSLLGVSNTDVCAWDNVSVVSFSKPSGPAIIVIEDTVQDTATGDCGGSYAGNCANLATIDVIPPGPGYYIRVEGSSRFNIDDGAQCTMELLETTGATQLDEVDFNVELTGTGFNAYLYTSFVSLTPLVAGVLQTYTINAKDASGDCFASGSTRRRVRATLMSSGR